MKNLWTEINERIPEYFGFFSQKYGLEFVKLSALKTAIVGNKFAIIISVGRFSVDVLYATRIEGRREVLQCGNFLAEKYSDEDRQNLLKSKGAENIILNNLKIIASGLDSKWGTLLRGEIIWIKDYRKSKWYSIVNLTQEENEVLWRLI